MVFIPFHSPPSLCCSENGCFPLQPQLSLVSSCLRDFRSHLGCCTTFLSLASGPGVLMASCCFWVLGTSLPLVSFFKPGLFNLNTLDILDWVSLCCGELYWVLQQVWQHPWPLATRHQQLAPQLYNQKIFPDIDTCPLGTDSLQSLEPLP